MIFYDFADWEDYFSLPTSNNFFKRINFYSFNVFKVAKINFKLINFLIDPSSDVF